MLGESSHCTIRPGTPADAPTLSEVFRLSWSSAYLGIIPQLHLDSMIRHRTQEWWDATIRSASEVLVLQVNGTVAGYATLGPARGRGKYEGEIYEIYVLPTHQGLGFGEHLFEACRHRLDRRQLRGLIVWALADNIIAGEFYLHRGGLPVGTTFERFGRSRLKKVAFAWE
ncbi:MAG: GNAT family N-acetyltransferase [Hyphomicrobium sp.]|jgi:GNAT superfamily N-acetyltransferase